MSNFLIDEDTDLLAAEFVLGTLDSEERANAQSLLRSDHGFIAMVRIWERRFGELHLMVEPIEPDAKITQRIRAKILEITGERAPVAQPPAELTAGPQLPETAAPPENAELPKPPDVAAAGVAIGGETAELQGGPAAVTAPPPTESAAIDETEKPVEAAPGAAVPAPTEAVPAPAEAASAEAAAAVPDPTSAVAPASAPLEVAPLDVAPPTAEVPAAELPESRPPESPATSDGEPIAIPPTPPVPSLKSTDRPPDKFLDQRAALIRSRRRWRMFGACMFLLVMGLVALPAAWKFAPDRVPPGLRPAELMQFVGIQTLPKPELAVKRAPPEPQFDE
jgi:hypothetical protein